MAFVAVKCNQCGANLEIDDSRTSGVCPYCKTAFVVDQAAHGTFSHGDRAAGGAGGYDPEDAYRRGKAFLRLKDQKHVQSVAEEMLLMRPDSPLGHLLYLELSRGNFPPGLTRRRARRPESRLWSVSLPRMRRPLGNSGSLPRRSNALRWRPDSGHCWNACAAIWSRRGVRSGRSTESS